MNSLPRMAGAPVETISPNSSAPSDFTGKSLMVLDEPNGGGEALKR